MRPAAILLAYFVAVIVLGALLAPPLYWAGQALAAHGMLTFLAGTEFQKFFNRAVLVAAVALLWPTVRALQLRSFRELGLIPDERRWQHAATGLCLAAIVVAAMALVYVSFDIYRWKKGDLPWGKVPWLFLSAVVVGVIEEALFRGAILGLFRRTLRPFAALFCVTAIFAAVHFLKPDEDFKITHVGWLSGFELLPHVFHQFTDPMTVLASFTTIFVLGWVCGYATLRTQSLWMAIGLHAGVVFVKMTFSKFTKRREELLPWIGDELQIGLVPVAVLVLLGVLVWLWLNYVDRPRRSLE